MPRGDKSKYIEEGYRDRGVPADEAEARAWATVNKMTGGGKKSGYCSHAGCVEESGARAFPRYVPTVLRGIQLPIAPT